MSGALEDRNRITRQLQETLVRPNTSPMVVRSTSVVVLSGLRARRGLPLLARGSGSASRAPAYRHAEH